MITTNLTLTSGATTEVPIIVTGITFEVDSKLAVNPSVVFPLEIVIGTSEIVGIDFDETLYTGDYTESITINTLGGRHDIVHAVTIDDLSEPIPIIDITFGMTTVGNQHFLGNAQGDDFLMYTGAGANLAAGQEITVPIADTYQTICYMLDGVVIYTEGTFTAGDYTIDQIGILQNYFFYDGILTTEEKAYLEYYPDRFIYKDNGVIKSGILLQDKIDLVRAFFPMCENGDYIVDIIAIVGLPIEHVVNGDFETDVIDNWDFNNYSAVVGDSKLDVTTIVGSGAIRYLVDTVDGTKYTFSFKPIAGTNIGTQLSVYDNINLVSIIINTPYDDTLDLIGVDFTATSIETYVYVLRDDVTTAGTISFDDVSVTSGTSNEYTISNYIDSVRTDAQMLTHGLTAFTERDDEGVVL